MTNCPNQLQINQSDHNEDVVRTTETKTEGKANEQRHAPSVNLNYPYWINKTQYLNFGALSWITWAGGWKEKR